MSWAYRLAERRGWPRWAGEILKQAVDQPLHVVMGIASILAIGAGLLVAGVGLVLATAISVAATAAWEIAREIHQGGSSRWWDPPLDYTFEIAGLALGTWLLYGVLGPLLL